jgi:hypothetical protein
MKYRVTISEINERVGEPMSATEAVAMDRGQIAPHLAPVFEQHFADLNVPKVIAFLNRTPRRRKAKAQTAT